MTSANIALLEDRGVIAVTGEDARKFLDNLITNDMDLLDKQPAIFAALLSPQGKILFDFFVADDDAGVLLDVARDQATPLAKRLSMYKLRAKVEIRDASEDHKVLAHWGQQRAVGPNEGCRLYRDPRHSGLGDREIIRRQSPPAYTTSWPEIDGRTDPFDDYHAHRIMVGVPAGGRDFAWGEVFPHEANMDQFNGLSFTKGCYVGQEIVSRMEHRGTSRRRLVRVMTGESALPPAGTEVKAGDVTIGALGSSAAIPSSNGSAHRHVGLAMLRLDRVAEFQALGVPLTAAGVTITPDAGDVARLSPRSEPAAP